MSWFDTVCRYAAHYCSSVCSRNDSPDNRDNRFFIYSTRSIDEFNHTHVTQGEGSGSFKDCQRTNGKGINLPPKVCIKYQI